MLLNHRSALDILHGRLQALPGVASAVVICPADERSAAVSDWATKQDLTCVVYEDAEARDKPRSLRQERWALEGDRGHDDLPGTVLARVAEREKAGLILVIPADHLAIDRESVQESLQLQFREDFDFLWSYDRLCGANWMILKAEMLLGLQKQHPEIMGYKGGLVWALQKPLYPFRAGEYHTPRAQPSCHADLRDIAERMPAALAATGQIDETSDRSFRYADWVGDVRWAKAYTDIGPQLVRAEPTNRCQGSCQACPHRLMQRPQVDLSGAVWQELVSELKSTSSRWSFSGIGEPFLHQQFAQMVEDVRGRHVTVETSLQVDPPSAFPFEAVDLLSISVDALEPTRFGRVREGCSWERIERFLAWNAQQKAAQPEHWPEVGVTMTKHQGTADLDLSFLDYWKKVVTPVFRTDFFRWPIDELPKSVQWYQIRGSSDYLGFQPYPARTRYTPMKRRPCRHALLGLHVLSDGRVTICPFDVDGRWILGNLQQQSPLEIWRSETARAFRAQHLERCWEERWPCARCQDWYHP
ncbi:MAG TPA: SPASM domain-containing protein [Candidatus Ozemobacteraceae bacterium]|nr:SPASM domain-containing protein [Candidatus Ozemobacteraceae bacterium]